MDGEDEDFTRPDEATAPVITGECDASLALLIPLLTTALALEADPTLFAAPGVLLTPAPTDGGNDGDGMVEGLLEPM